MLHIWIWGNSQENLQRKASSTEKFYELADFVLKDPVKNI